MDDAARPPCVLDCVDTLIHLEVTFFFFHFGIWSILQSAVDSACPKVKESAYSVNLHSFGECFKWHLGIESKIQLPSDKEGNDQGPL